MRRPLLANGRVGVRGRWVNGVIRLPVRDGSVSAAVAVMAHTDTPEYPAVLAEVARVLAPGGVFVHIGVHPCFCGGFAEGGGPTPITLSVRARKPGGTAARRAAGPPDL